MLSEGMVYEIPAVPAMWAMEWTPRPSGKSDWREVDRRARRLARDRARLDYEELIVLREGMRVKVWREVGCASMREYIERVFGYGPRAANERLRVAAALEALPALEDALAAGELPYSAVREISRIATPRTERAWVDACRGKCLREIEEMVAERAVGDGPDAPARPELRKHVVRLDLDPSEYALWRQARQVLQSQRGEAVNDGALLAAACSALIEQAGAPRPTEDRNVTTAAPASGRVASDAQRGRAKYQIAVTVCEVCGQGWQEGAGRQLPMDRAEVERAECDAQRIGSLDGEPQAAVQDIPPKVRRFVFRRDRDRCTVPGCRASSFIEVHHIVRREYGGGHEPENLTLLCGGHHDRLHDGSLVIRGRAPQLKFERVGMREAHVGAPAEPPDPQEARLERRTRDDAVRAIHKLGYSKAEAVAAVDSALTDLDGPPELERLLRLALPRCLKPVARGTS